MKIDWNKFHLYGDIAKRQEIPVENPQEEVANFILGNGYITIRYYGETKTTSVSNPGNIVGVYEYNLDGIEENGIEGVLKEDAYPSGTLVRAILYGSLTNNTSSWEYFYRSENSEDWYTIEY